MTAEKRVGWQWTEATSFYVSRRNSGTGRAYISAGVYEDPGDRVRISKSNSVHTKRSQAFTYNADLTSASIEPGACFLARAPGDQASMASSAF